MEERLDIKSIYKVILKRWMIIMLLPIIFSMISGVICYFIITPKYQASTQILVNQKDSNNLDSTQLKSNIDLINTYSVIIKSPAILDKVINKLELNQNVGQLNSNILIGSQQNSQVFSLTVQDNNPGRAVEIANAISETFQQEIKGIMNIDNVSILAKAELNQNPTPVTPKPLLYITASIAVGLIIGIGIAFLLEYLDNSLKDSRDVEAFLGLPVLGSISDIKKQKSKSISVVSKKGVETLEG